MNKIIACLFVLSVGACASDESGRRHPETARAGVDTAHRHHHDRAVGEAAEADIDGHDHDRAHDPVVVGEQPSAVKPVAVANAPVDADGKVVRDADGTRVTRSDKAEQPSDSELTRRIRKAVTADDQLTSTAKNVKITTQDGRVTLQGKVTNDREKTAVDSYARQVAGESNVDNQLVIQ